MQNSGQCQALLLTFVDLIPISFRNMCRSTSIIQALVSHFEKMLLCGAGSWSKEPGDDLEPVLAGDRDGRPDLF